MRLVVLGIVLLAACGADETLLVVDVRTDLEPGTEFTVARIDLIEETGGAGTSSRSARRDAAAGESGWTTGQRVAELRVTAGEWTVEGALLDASGTPVATARRTVTVREGRTEQTTLILYAGCGELCPDPDAGMPDAGPLADAGPPVCGDGVTTGTENCDDENDLRWDGCDPDCTAERALIFDRMDMAAADDGCDLVGDSRPDNALGQAYASIASILNAIAGGAIADGRAILLATLIGVRDPAAATDFELGIAEGADADMDASNNLGGMGRFLLDPAALSESLPQWPLPATLTATGALTAGPADVSLTLQFGAAPFPLRLLRATLNGTAVVEAGEVTGLEDALLCGATPIAALAGVRLDESSGMMWPAGCDGSAEPGTAADATVAGGGDTGFGVEATMPDIDVDGDGLETFEIDATGPPEGCQPVIVNCIDGGGMRIPGRRCVFDSRIADAYSAAFRITGVRATIVGIAP